MEYVSFKPKAAKTALFTSRYAPLNLIKSIFIGG